MKQNLRPLHRLSSAQTEPYLKFLKPGSLAQIRDSRMSARSIRLNSLLQISAHRATPPSSPPSNDAQPQVNAIDGFPYFSARTYGPNCPRRKKLMAAKTVLFFSSRPSSPVSDSPDDPLISGLNNDSVAVAH